MAHHPKYLITTEELGRLSVQTAREVLESFDENDLIKLSPGHIGIPPHLVRAYLLEKGVDYSCKVVAHINLKGGTGKTTTAITAATRAAQYGFKTCIIDMDPQGSASLAFDMDPKEDDPIFCDVWQQPAEMVLGSLRTIDRFLYILPSSLDNELLDVQLMKPEKQKHAVRAVCEELKPQGFNLIMIDCPPSIGTAVISTICAADIIVIPVCSDAFSRRGLALTLNEIAAICETFHLEQPKIKILYTKFDRRVKMSADTLQQLLEQYRKSFIRVPIRTSTAFAKALEKRMTIFASTKKSFVKDDYDKYVRHLLGLNAVFEKEE